MVIDLYTRKFIDSILKAMWEENGLPEHMEEKMEQIRKAFDERDAVLKQYGEPWDEDEDSFDFKPLPTSDEWENKYKDLESRYISRFFTGGEGDNGGSDTNGTTNLNEIIANQNEDISNDDSEKTIDELFKED